MRKKEIEKIAWTAPVIEGCCSIAATILPGDGKKAETLIVDVTNTVPAVRFCLSKTEIASYFPANSPLAKKKQAGAYWTEQRPKYYWSGGVEYNRDPKDRNGTLREKYETGTEKRIKAFIKKHFDWEPISCLNDPAMEWISHAVSHIKVDRYRKRIQKCIDHKNRAERLIKTPPKAFLTWIEQRFTTADYRSEITIAPFYGKDETTGICSHCGKEHTYGKTILREKKHTCPHCGQVCEVYRFNYKAKDNEKWPRELHSEWREFSFVQEYDGGLVERFFSARKETYIHEERMVILEYKRAFIKDGRAYVHVKRGGSWWPVVVTGDNVWSGIDKENFYMKSVKDLVQKEKYRYSALDLAMERCGEWMTSPIKYMYHYEQAPGVVESLIKLGMDNLAYSIRKGLVKSDKGKLWQRLGITKAEFGMLKESGYGAWMLEWMLRFKENGERFTEYDLAFLKGGISKKDMDGFAIGSYHQFFKYLEKQVGLRKGRTVGSILSTWSDYLDMAQTLKMDLSNPYIYQPKDVKASHDRVAAELAIIREKETMEERENKVLSKHPHVNAILSALSDKYAYKNDTYCIVCPTRINDIIEEGLALSHCLHSDDKYFARIERRESYIVFLRRTSAPDVPYYTLEIEPNGSTRQERTTGDNQNEDYQDAVSFIREWQKAIRPRLTAKDRELSRISAILREQEFKEMRDTNALIRRGKYAGQPLADVLEADFLDADLFADVAFVEPEVMPDFELPAVAAG